MNDAPRARRRQARWRMVQRAIRLYRRFDRHTLGQGKRRPHDAEKTADNMAWCRHWLCRHRREREGPTRRELKQMEDQ